MSIVALCRPISFALVALVTLSACSEGRAPIAPANKDASASGDEDAAPGVDALSSMDTGMIDTGPAPNCDLNPSGCADGQLRGPAPACMCLMGCNSGFTWNGTTCVADAPPDAGQAPDAMVAPDAEAADAVVGDPDAAPVDPDAAPVNPDATTANPDATTANPDAAPVGGDATVVVDGGVAADAQVGVDGAVVTPDGGVAVDGGFVPSGLAEGDACNWQQPNNCLQAPGMICQQLDAADPTNGICLRTCDVAQNTVAGANPACAGIGPNCVDIGLSPTGGRCLTARGPYQDLVDVLDVCDPNVPNLFIVGGTTCWPLCTVMLPPPPASQTPVTCTGRFNTCINELTFNDGVGGTLGSCGVRTTRSSTCTESLGVYCNAADICVLGRCHQRSTTAGTCAGTTCAVAGESCIVAGTAPNQVGFCHDPCSVFQAGTCNGTDACELTGFGGAPTGSCRTVAGAIPALGDCSDPLDLGTHANECVAGTTCLPVGTTNDFTEAACLQLCSGTLAGAPACPTGQTCTAFGTPFQSYGVCF